MFRNVAKTDVDDDGDDNDEMPNICLHMIYRLVVLRLVMNCRVP